MPNKSRKINMNDGAGDLPNFPIGPVESFQLEEAQSTCSASSVSHHDERAKPINYQFTFHEVIGKGGFSKVKKATHKATGDTYAVKILDKSKIQEGEFPRVILEIETLASLKHPCICQLYSAFYTSSKIYMVMEYCFTDLYEYMIRLNKPLPEVRAWKLFVQLLAAVSYIHSIGIVHRDIKPENILLSMDMRIKLSDFGFAAKVPQDRKRFLSTYCGSLAYGAPEVLSGVPYCGEKADIWSLGVNLYVFLSLRQPFFSKKTCEIRGLIMAGQYKFSSHFNKRSRALISRLLQVDPTSRPDIPEIWKDPWVTQKNVSTLFQQLGYKIDQINPPPFSSDQVSNENMCKTESVSNNQSTVLYKPTCRDEPVQVEISSHRTRFRVFLNSTRRRCRNFVSNLFSCRRSRIKKNEIEIW